MGQQVIAGWVREERIAEKAMLRVDVPDRADEPGTGFNRFLVWAAVAVMIFGTVTSKTTLEEVPLTETAADPFDVAHKYAQPDEDDAIA